MAFSASASMTQGADHFVGLASKSGPNGNGVEFLIEDFKQVGHGTDHDLWDDGRGEDGGHVRGNEEGHQPGAGLHRGG